MINEASTSVSSGSAAVSAYPGTGDFLLKRPRELRQARLACAVGQAASTRTTPVLIDKEGQVVP
eukprot:1155725-Pleurochrysis_carterae.AAC.6